MSHLLLDLTLESKASTLLTLRLSRTLDPLSPGPGCSKSLSRIGVPAMKFFVTKRQPNFVYECMEILGKHLLEV